MIHISNYWLFSFFILASFVLAFYYYRNSSLSNKLIKYTVTFIRFLTLLTICTILLSPILKCNKSKTIKPTTAVLIDNSKSIRNSKAKFTKEKLNNFLHSLNLDEDDMKTYVFDADLKTEDSFNSYGLRTNILSALENVSNLNVEENLKRIILITDGNYNLGNNPIFFSNPGLAELDILLIGDTTKIADARVENLEHNPIMMSDEVNIVNAIVSFSLMDRKSVMVKLVEYINNKVQTIEQRTIGVKSQYFSQNIQFKIRNPKKGKHRYGIVVESGIEDLNKRNNQKTFVVDVIDGKKTIEIISSFPHPDIGALKSILEKNKSFNIQLNVNAKPTINSLAADLYILYQYPSIDNDEKGIVDQIKKAGKSILFVLGTQSDFRTFNAVQNAYRVNVKGQVIQNYFPEHNARFSKFYLNDGTISYLSGFPPLSNYLLTIETEKEPSHLLFSNMGKVKTQNPLISVSKDNNIPIGLIAGENIWKWKLNNYKYKKNFAELEDLLNKLVDYLAIHKDKKQLVATVSNNNVSENSNIVIIANTYNELYQSVKASTVKCLIEGDNNYRKEYNMISEDDSYRLTPKGLKKGNYKYKVEAILDGKKLTETGSFSIFKEEVEDYYLPANFEDMNSLAIKNNGQLYMFDNWQATFKTNTKKDYANKIVKESRQLKPNDILILLLILLGLLSIEWLIRKFFGQP